MNEKTQRFSYIDTLRGYAVLGVLVVHSSQYAGYNGGWPAVGARGVQLFFVASAVTLTSSWHRRNDGAFPFFVRRAFRILPMFWIALSLYWTLEFGAGQTIAAAALLQTIRPDWIVAPLVPGGWSVCTEAAFYGIFPLIVSYVTTLRKSVIFFIIALGIGAVTHAVGGPLLRAAFPWAAKTDIANMLALTIPNQMPIFAAGVATYFVIPRLCTFHRGILETVLVLDITAAIWYAAFHEENFAAFGIIFAVGTACLANGAGAYLINKTLVHVGRCSYSIYLLHFKFLGIGLPLVTAMSPFLKLAVIFAVTTCVTVVVSTTTYFTIEVPFIRLGERLIRRRLAIASI
jgi:peptidoglycan/LPS O-acetylase OafA/YrhL